MKPYLIRNQAFMIEVGSSCSKKSCVFVFLGALPDWEKEQEYCYLLSRVERSWKAFWFFDSILRQDQCCEEMKNFLQDKGVVPAPRQDKPGGSPSKRSANGEVSQARMSECGIFLCAVLTPGAFACTQAWHCQAPTHRGRIAGNGWRSVEDCPQGTDPAFQERFELTMQTFLISFGKCRMRVWETSINETKLSHLKIAAYHLSRRGWQRDRVGQM